MKPAAVALGVGGAMIAALLAVMAVGMFLTGLSEATATPPAGNPSAYAVSDIPPEMLAIYQKAAATCPGLSWSVLAAIGSVETDHGRSTLPGGHSGANFAGAEGPMQLLPDTWAAYGADGDGDGVKDVYNPADAVFGAANYLCANGAGDPEKLHSAIWNYNHSEAYIDDVLARAARYSDAASLTPASATSAAALVDNPNLILTDGARADLLGGVVDQRVVDFLASLVVNHRIAVSVIKTGHSQYVNGTDRVSNHYYGRAVDIYAVDGVDVTASADGAHALAEQILGSAPPLRPDELGSPWSDLERYPGAFADADHTDHVHAGWRASVLFGLGFGLVDGRLVLLGVGLHLARAGRRRQCHKHRPCPLGLAAAAAQERP
jgi:hypothetical protein